MKSIVRTLCAVLIFCWAVWAHGDERHVLGTVTKIGADAITVSTGQGVEKLVSIVPSTKFLKAGSPATLKDLKIGDRVAVHAKPKGELLEATEVKIGSAKGPAK